MPLVASSEVRDFFILPGHPHPPHPRSGLQLEQLALHVKFSRKACRGGESATRTFRLLSFFVLAPFASQATRSRSTQPDLDQAAAAAGYRSTKHAHATYAPIETPLALRKKRR